MVQQTACPHYTTSPGLIHFSHLATTMWCAFPMFGFPSNTVPRISTQYEYADLFEVAQFRGKQSFTLLQKMPKAEARLLVRIAATSSVEIHFRDIQKITWVFCGKRDSTRHKLDRRRRLTVRLYNESSEESTEVPELVFAKTTTISYCCTSNCPVKVVQFIRHICTLFNATVEELDICPSKLHHLEEIQSHEVLKKSREVVVRKGTVAHEDMRRVLGGFESTKMTILCNPEPNFTFDGTISVKKIRAYDSSWFKGPMLLNLVNCESVYLTGSRISEEHLNIFLHEWLKKSTGCGTIRLLDIAASSFFGFKYVYEQKEWDLDKISQGLSSFRQPLPSLTSSHNYSKTRRFCRKIDDTIIDVYNFGQSLRIRREGQRDVY